MSLQVSSQSRLTPVLNLHVVLYFIPQGLAWFWGMLSRRTRVCWFWEADAPPSPPLPPSSVSSACVIHTDGNNFFQLLEEVGEACSLLCWVFHSLAPPFLPWWLRRAFPPDSHPLAAAFLILCLPYGWGLAF